MRKRANEFDVTGLEVGRNVARLRAARRLSLRQMSGMLDQLGRPITASALQKVEAHSRRVDADDLIALAVVLGVSPTALLLPPTAQHGGTVTVTGAGQLDAGKAWEWANGMRPLGEDDPLPSDDPDADADAFYRMHAGRHLGAQVSRHRRSLVHEQRDDASESLAHALTLVLRAFASLGLSREDVLNALAYIEDPAGDTPGSDDG